MSKTNDLRKLIQTKLKTIMSDVYYEVADRDALYPHIVFDLSFVNLGDLSRQDYQVVIDIWDKGTSAVRVEEVADTIESMFNNLNNPTDSILPTFFIESKRVVIDEDKKIRHRQIVLSVQNYER